MGARKVRTAVRQDQIARAAMELIAERGPAGFSMGDLAARVGVVPSALYRHFRGKEQVLDAVLDLIRRRLLDIAAAAREEGRDPLHALQILLTRHAALVARNRGMPLVIMFFAFGEGSEKRRLRLYGRLSEYTAHVADLIRQGQEQGLVRRDIDRPAAAILFLGIIQSAAILHHVTGGRLDIERQVAKAWQVYAAGLRVGAGHAAGASAGAAHATRADDERARVRSAPAARAIPDRVRQSSVK